MHQETPAAIIGGQAPFERDGSFNDEKAINLALEQRALGDIDSADALDLLIDFFSTSQNYIFNGDYSLNHEFSSAERDPLSPASPA